jgi:peptidoglycan/xylan/chitin deacetylase (PgdA/CDA1 family)
VARPPYRPTPLLLGSAALHTAGALALAAAPQHWALVAGGLFANHVVLAAASLQPRGLLIGANLTSLPGDAARRGEACLTFDDGPDPEVTPRVLEMLDRAGARATFFCIGRRAAAHPDIVREIVQRGHRVENHTHTHPNLFACYPPWGLRREIQHAQDALERAAGRRPLLFRAPAGFRNPLLDWVLHRSGLSLLSWTRRGFDTVERDPAVVAARLLRGLAPGDVLLLHDGSAARGRRGTPVVLEALPRVLDALAERGLRSVPYPDPHPPAPSPVPSRPPSPGEGEENF